MHKQTVTNVALLTFSAWVLWLFLSGPGPWWLIVLMIFLLLCVSRVPCDCSKAEVEIEETT